MQIAVARVEHVGAAQPVLAFHPGDTEQDFRQLLAWNGAVHAVIVRRDAARRREGVLASRPEAQALGFGLRYGDGGGTAGVEHFAHAADFFFNFSVGAVRFAQQDRFGIDVVAGLDERLDHARTGLVHHLQSGRDDARSDDVGDGIAALHHIVERGHDHARLLRLGHQLDGDFRNNAEHAFGADEYRQQIEAGRIKAGIAELDDITFDGNHAHAQDVVNGQTVFEAMHAAGVFGDVAADTAGDLRGGIRGVIQAVRRGRFRNGQIAYAGLHHGGPVVLVHADDLVDLGCRHYDAVGYRHRAARQTGAGAARDDLDFQVMAGLENGDDLRFVLRQYDDHG